LNSKIIHVKNKFKIYVLVVARNKILKIIFNKL